MRYTQLRPSLRAFLADRTRNARILGATHQSLQQRSEDSSLSDFLRDDALLSIDALEAFHRMQNQLAEYDFQPAPSPQPLMRIAGVDISVNLDLLVARTQGAVEQLGGALFRFTKADEETDAAAAKRRDMGLYAATIIHMHVVQNLAGNRQPTNRLCLSIDVQCGEVHVAPRNYAQRAQNIESSCRFIAAMWDRA